MNDASANEAPVIAAQPEPPTFGRERLAPGAYYLDLAAVVDYPLRDNGQPSTFADIYRKLMDAKIVKTPDRGLGRATFETEAGEVTITGDSDQDYRSGELFVIRVLADLMGLLKDGIDPYRTTWFYYGHDWSCDGDELYSFFLVHDGNIVRDRLSFIHCAPRVLEKHKPDDKPIWHSERYEHEAWEAYWYRKFYTETLTGQLMVLRPDEPVLYHFNRAGHDATRDITFVTLIKAYHLLWIAVALITAIAFPDFRPYLAFFAGALFVDLLYRIWATRKVGQTG